MNGNRSQQLTGAVLLMLTAFIWGCAFVAQSVAMDDMGPFSFCMVRFLISGVILFPVIWFRHYAGIDAFRRYAPGKPRATVRGTVIAGMICGVFLFLGAGLQQIGVQYTTAGNAGFLTALYIILVPIYSIFLGKRPKRTIWIAALLAMAGMYLLCIDGKFTLSRGDLFCILCALAFPCQILALDYFVQRVDAIVLSSVQFLTVSALAAVFAFTLETPALSQVRAALIPILYAGVMSGGLAYTLQAVGQQKMQNASAASLIMSLESVFAALAGIVLLNEAVSPRKLLGCVIMFAAIILAQI